MSFKNPYYFLLFVFLLFAVWRVYGRRIVSGILFAPASYIKREKKTWRIYLSQIIPLFIISGIMLSIISLARPQKTVSSTNRIVRAIAIEMVLDVSGSMDSFNMGNSTNRNTLGVKDYYKGHEVNIKTRLNAAKDSIAFFINQRPYDLIGLITFGGYAVTRSPLTSNHQDLLHIMRKVEVPRQNIDSDGQISNLKELRTAIGDAIASACRRMEDSKLKTKIIILVSDGESNAGIIRPQTAAMIAKHMGIKIYTIGISNNTHGDTNKVEYFSSVLLDEDLLQEIAVITGGRYFNVNSRDDLKETMKEIDNLEKTNIKINVYNKHKELFAFLLWPAICLIAIGTSLNVFITKRII